MLSVYCSSQVRKTLTVPRMRLRQTAQLRSAGAQLSHDTRCPQGKKTTLTSRSMQTRHVRASRSCLFSSSNITVSVKHNTHIGSPIKTPSLLPYVRRLGSGLTPSCGSDGVKSTGLVPAFKNFPPGVLFYNSKKGGSNLSGGEGMGGGFR